MFKSLFDRRRKKEQRNAQLTDNNIPNHLKNPEREEDGFVLLGETISERNTVYPDHYKTPSPLCSQPPEPLLPSYQQPPSYQEYVSNHWLPVNAMGQQPSNQKIVKQTGHIESSQREGSNASSCSNIPSRPKTPNRKMTAFVDVPFHTVTQTSDPNINSNGPSLVNVNSSPVIASQHQSPVADVPFKLGEFLQLYTRIKDSNDAGVPQLSTSLNLQAYKYDFELERSVVRQFEANLSP